MLLAAGLRPVRSLRVAFSRALSALAAALCRARPWRIEGPATAGKSRSTAATNKRILALLDKPPPQATPDGRVRCWPRHWATLTFSMSGASCASTLSPCRSQVVVREQRPFVRGESRRRGRAYVDPPVKAIVLCVDEKPSIQALERAQGYLKLPNGRALPQSRIGGAAVRCTTWTDIPL